MPISAGSSSGFSGLIVPRTRLGAFTVMSNDEDFVLTLMKPKKLDPVAYPETFQVGFHLDNSPAVQAKPSRAKPGAMI